MHILQRSIFFSDSFIPFVNDFLDFSKLTKSLYYQLLSVKGDSDTEKGGSVSSFETVRVMHVLKKKTGAALQLGLFGFLFKIWLFKLGAKGLFWRILHGLRDWHQNLTFIWCTALSVSKWFSLEEMYPENIKKNPTAQVKCTEEWKKGCFKVLKIKQAKEKKVKKN